MSKYGSFNIKGIEKLEKAINEMVSGTKAGRIKRQAVNAGSDVVVECLKQNYDKAGGKYSKGFTKQEVMHSNARTKNDVVEAKAGWHGPHDRWRLIHLEEWGYVKSGKQYKPPTYDLIDKTLKEAQEPYFQAVRGVMLDFL